LHLATSRIYFAASLGANKVIVGDRLAADMC